MPSFDLVSKLDMGELKNALEKNILKNTLENEFYFNIKRMKNLKLN